MGIYIGYRHHEFDLDLVDGGAAEFVTPGIENFQTVAVGSKISF